MATKILKLLFGNGLQMRIITTHEKAMNLLNYKLYMLNPQYDYIVVAFEKVTQTSFSIFKSKIDYAVLSRVKQKLRTWSNKQGLIM